jgi:hypothetical protein
MKDKLWWLWNNIKILYNIKGDDIALFWSPGYCVLTIESHDNYYYCKIRDVVLNNSKSFKISIEHSIIGVSEIYIEEYVYLGGIDGIINYLKPVFREFKIEKLYE